jgi:hypothetical protein
MGLGSSSSMFTSFSSSSSLGGGVTSSSRSSTTFIQNGQRITKTTTTKRYADGRVETHVSALSPTPSTSSHAGVNIEACDPIHADVCRRKRMQTLCLTCHGVGICLQRITTHLPSHPLTPPAANAHHAIENAFPSHQSNMSFFICVQVHRGVRLCEQRPSLQASQQLSLLPLAPHAHTLRNRMLSHLHLMYPRLAQ